MGSENDKISSNLDFLKRKSKLDDRKDGKDDCDLSNDLFRALTKVDLIKLDDYFYNVFYNQSYALNQNFGMFKSILENSINKLSIPLRNNKFINFDDILKMIYYFKKEKMQKLIENIYSKDLKYMHKQIIDYQSNMEDMIEKAFEVDANFCDGLNRNQPKKSEVKVMRNISFK